MERTVEAVDRRGMTTGQVDISVVVTAHHEGRLAHHTIRSVRRSAEYARQRGIVTEIIVVLDRANQKTEDYFSVYKGSDVVVESVGLGDPGLARNHGVAKASGTYVGLLDADDLMGREWIHKAVSYLSSTEKDIIARPEYQIVFGAKNLLFRQRSSDDPEVYLEDLLDCNHWTNICVARREIFSANPFQRSAPDSGFGFEDWHFNCETLADGIEHHVVPETVQFIRAKKSGSRLAFDNESSRLVRPTRLFEPKRFSSLLAKREHRWGDNNQLEKRSDSPPSFPRQLIRAMGRFRSSLYRSTMSIVIPMLRSSSVLYKTARTLKGALQRTTSARSLPEWLMEEWRAIHAIDPVVFPEERVLRTIEIYQVPVARSAECYAQLYGAYGEGVSHVFLVPWLKRGGADLEALNYIAALIRYGLGSGVVVITTENTDSPWAARLPQGVRVIPLGRMCARLSAREQERLLARLILQAAPWAVHNLNSDLGYRVFVKHGVALKQVSSLYANVFCQDITEDGNWVGYALSYLPECVDHLKAVGSDNCAFLDELRKIYAFDPEKLFVHYQPMEIARRRAARSQADRKDGLDILWAGRMDRQKRPDLLERIAEACQGLPFRFHVYGTPLLNHDISLRRLNRLRNVTCYGAFDGLSSLSLESYDVFLYTSQWDGLPNVLLEAMSAGLPVVASHVGGVSEAVVHGQTGFLIDPYDHVPSFVECLKSMDRDRDRVQACVTNAYEMLESRHSWDRFVEELRRFPGYVVQRS